MNSLLINYYGYFIDSATGRPSEVVAELLSICQETSDPLHHLELALALNRTGEFVQAFKGECLQMLGLGQIPYVK